MSAISLTGPQRDFLASYPSEVVVDIIESEEGSIRIYADGDVTPELREVSVPPEGFIDQPVITLRDPTVPDSLESDGDS